MNQTSGVCSKLLGMRLADVLAGGPGRGCHGPNCGRPPNRGIEKAAFPLTPVQKTMESRFRAAVSRDPEGMKAKYRAKFGNVLSADNAKELSLDYERNRTDGAPAVHEPASWLVKQLYAEELAKPAPPGKENKVLFTAGGAGAGKTSAIGQIGHVSSLNDKAQIIYDGTLRPASKAVRVVQQALDAGKEAHVVFCYRHPEEAFRDGILGRASRQEAEIGSGRTVPLSEFAIQHASVLDSMKVLAEKYKNDPRVSLTVIDNSRGRGKAQMVDLKDIPKSPEAADLHRELLGVLDQELKAGRISKRIYHATKGPGAAKEVGM